MARRNWYQSGVGLVGSARRGTLRCCQSQWSDKVRISRPRAKARRLRSVREVGARAARSGVGAGVSITSLLWVGELGCARGAQAALWEAAEVVAEEGGAGAFAVAFEGADPFDLVEERGPVFAEVADAQRW